MNKREVIGHRISFSVKPRSYNQKYCWPKLFPSYERAAAFLSMMSAISEIRHIHNVFANAQANAHRGRITSYWIEPVYLKQTETRNVDAAK